MRLRFLHTADPYESLKFSILRLQPATSETLDFKSVQSFSKEFKAKYLTHHHMDDRCRTSEPSVTQLFDSQVIDTVAQSRLVKPGQTKKRGGVAVGFYIIPKFHYSIHPIPAFASLPLLQ
jgi:hypothetical protein